MWKQAGLRAAGMAAAALVFLSATSAHREKSCRLQIFDTFDTISEITVVTSGDGDRILEECHKLLREDDALYSPTREESDISKINRAAGSGEAVPIHKKTAKLLAESKRAYLDTNGFFDISVGALVKAWGIGTDSARVPEQEELTQALHLIGLDSLTLDENANTASLSKSGQRLDLGGIAKGAATEDLLALLKKEGINSALINLGGNTYALGTRPDKSAWEIGIQDPSDPDSLIGTLQVYNKAVITSGSYQRYFEENGVRYHHILNPYTGMPSKSGLLSVTVISADPSEADMLSTACFLLGYSESQTLLKEFGADAVFVTEDQTVYYSSSLSLSYENENYSYQTF